MSRLQIMGRPYPKIPFRQGRIPNREKPGIVEDNVSDPSICPAHYTKALVIGSPTVVTTVDAEAGSWIKGFSRVVHLVMAGQTQFAFGWGAAFIQFCGFSPIIKSLLINRVAFPPTLLSNLILSFPLLEDLSITDCYRMLVNDGSYPDGLATGIQPAGLPVFTGSLQPFIRGGIGHIVHGWMSQPGGSIHFRKLTLTWFYEDISLTMALVEKRPHTLESLDITRNGTPTGRLHSHGSNSLLFQPIGCQLRSTSRKQHSSGM